MLVLLLPIREALKPIILLAGTHQVLACLVICEDEHRPWHAGEPVQDVDWLRAKDRVERVRVDEDCTEQRLEDEAEAHETVAQALLENGQLPRFGDEQVGPLHDND